MDKLQSKTELIQKLRDIINYLSNKTPYSINFNDADEYEYEIYLIANEWDKIFPEQSFENEFPIIDKLWELLGSWNVEDEKDLKKCEQIIELAKKAKSELVKSRW